MGDHPAELVGPDGGRLRDRRARDQPRRRPLCGARGPPPRPGLPADVRPGSHRAEGADPPVQALRRPGRPHHRLSRRRARRRPAQPVPDGGLHPTGRRLRRARGRAGARREDGRDLHLTRPRHQRTAGECRGVRRPLPRVRRGARAPQAGVGGAVACVRHAAAGERSRPTRAALPHLPCPASLFALHGRPGRRCAGARSQRRGIPRARLLGRALCLSVPELPPSRHHPRPADVPLPTSRPGPGRRAGRRLPRRDVSVAERQRRQGRDTGRPPQPAIGPVGAGPQSQPAARQRRDLLQHLELLRGHRGPRLPARVRRRDDARDRALLGLDRQLQPRPGPL